MPNVVSKSLFMLMWLILSAIVAFKVYGDFTFYYEVEFMPCFMFGMFYWSTWALLARYLTPVSNLLSGSNRYWLRFLICHLITGIVISLVNYVLMKLTFHLFHYWQWYPHAHYPRSMLLLNYSIYVAMVAIEHANWLFKRNAGLEIREAQLRTELVGAQLQGLRMQLRPHFFFNSLNTVRMLIETDPQKAIRMTILLGDFLRKTLDSQDENEVTLQTELEFARSYLEIQKIRFENRITVTFEIDENQYDVLVPNLILQPLVENAMLHGCGKSEKHGALKISTNQVDDVLFIFVDDSGCGSNKNSFSERIGLSNTRTRLQSLYGEKGDIRIVGTPEGATSVELRIPIRRIDD